MGSGSNHKSKENASEQMEHQLSDLENQLNSQEQYYNHLLNELDYDIHKCRVIRNDDGEIVKWVFVDINQSNLASWNKTKEDVIGKTPNEVFDYDVIAQFIPIVNQVFETDKPVEWIEYFEPIQQYLKMKTIPYGDCFISVGRNVTNEKLAELDVEEIKKSLGDLGTEQDKDAILFALHQNKQQFENIANNLPGVVLRYKLNPDGTDELLYISKGAEKLYEESQEKIVNDVNLIWEKIHKVDLELMIPSIQKSAQEMSVWEFEYRLIFPDKRIKWVDLRGFPSKQKDGSIIWDTIGLDVTKLKETELNLKQINENLEELVEKRAKRAFEIAKNLELYKLATTQSKAGVWHLDLKKDNLVWDEVMYELYGVDQENFKGAYEVWAESLHPEDKEATVNQFNQAIAQRKVFDTRFRIIQRNTGEVVYIKAIGKLDYDFYGQPIAMFGTNWDITKEMELVEEKQKIIDQLEFYQLAASNAKAGVWFFTPNKGGSEWDDTLYEIYEIDRKDYPDNILPVNVWSEWIHPEDRDSVLQTFNESLEFKKSFSIHYRIITVKTKKTKYVKATGKFRLNEHGDLVAVYGFNWDITGQMELVNQLNETIQNLKSAELELINSEKMASLGVLTAGVAHEINNPLNYIAGGAAAIEKHLIYDKKVDKDKVNEYLTWIKTGANKASRIVKSLNRFSVESKEHNEVCDIHQIIEDCLLFVHNRYQDRIEIKKEFCAQEIIISGNDAELRQAFLNIIINAIDAIENKGHINISTQTKDNNYEIQVIDDGCGIPEDLIHKIKDPFFTTKPAGKAVGLGLSITNTTIIEHHGTLEFESELGKGTKVRIRFQKDTTPAN